MTFVPAMGRKEENVLFNDALNTFYLRLYSVRSQQWDDHNWDTEVTLGPGVLDRFS